MKFSEVIKKWEDGWRGKFKNKYGALFEVNDNGIYYVHTKNHVNCINIILSSSYELIKEPKKVTFEETFTNSEYAYKSIYPENNIECMIKGSRNSWLYHFYKNPYLFSSAFKTLWIIED